MVKKKQEKNAYVKNETMMLVAFVCLIVGFFGGVVFSSYKTRAGIPGQAVTPPPEHSGNVSKQAAKIPELEKAVTRDPENVSAWIQLGNAYFDINQFEKAAAAYEKSLKLDPTNANVWTDMGVMYRRMKDPQKALESFDKAIAADPSHEVSRINKGIVLMHDLNDEQGALKAWEELVAINPLATASNGQPIKDLVEHLKQHQEPEK